MMAHYLADEYSEEMTAEEVHAWAKDAAPALRAYNRTTIAMQKVIDEYAERGLGDIQ